LDEDTKLFYKLTARKTADEWYPNDILMPSLEEFVGLLPEHPRVLDLGCGGGYESMRLTIAGARVVGVDFSEESIRIAQERCPDADFELMDFRKLDREKLGSFNGIFACASLIHISPEELPGVFTQLRNVLTPNGLVVAILREGEGVWERQLEIEGRKLRRVVYLYSRETLSAAATGFRYLQAGYLAPDEIAKGWRSHIFQRVDRMKTPKAYANSTCLVSL